MRVKVAASSKSEGVSVRNGIVLVRVSCPAEKSKANRRAIGLLEKEFGCKVTITSGMKSRDKEICFDSSQQKIDAALSRLEKKGGC